MFPILTIINRVSVFFEPIKKIMGIHIDPYIKDSISTRRNFSRLKVFAPDPLLYKISSPIPALRTILLKLPTHLFKYFFLYYSMYMYLYFLDNVHSINIHYYSYCSNLFNMFYSSLQKIHGWMGL